MASLCSRLEKQLQLLVDREDQMIAENRRLMQEVANRETLNKKIEGVNEAKEKLTTLWERVKSQYAELDRQREEDFAEDRQLRQALSAELQERISKMNDEIESTSRQRSEALALNEELKRKLEVISKSSAERGNITKIFEEQESSNARAQEGLAGEIASIPAIKAEVEKLRPEHEALQKECAALETETRQYAEKFQDVEKLVLGVHRKLKAEDEQRKKILKKLDVAEREMMEAGKRCEKAWQERDALRAAVEKHDKQLKLLETQVDKLRALSEVLANQAKGGASEKPSATPTNAGTVGPSSSSSSTHRDPGQS